MGRGEGERRGAWAVREERGRAWGSEGSGGRSDRVMERGGGRERERKGKREKERGGVTA